MDPLTLAALAFVALILCGLVAGTMANGQHRDGAVWFLVGLVFGPLALLALLIGGPMPSRDHVSRRE